VGPWQEKIGGGGWVRSDLRTEALLLMDLGQRKKAVRNQNEDRDKMGENIIEWGKKVVLQDEPTIYRAGESELC